MTFAAFKALMAGLPWRLIGLVAFAVAVAAAVLYGAHRLKESGRAEVRAEWAASIERGKRELERRAAERAKITVKTETVYVDKIRVVREKGQTLIQRIPALVPADACLLPAGWRLSHDSAVAGTVPDTANDADAGAAGAEAIAWRPWNSRPGTASGHDGRRELHPVSPRRRAAEGASGVDP